MDCEICGSSGASKSVQLDGSRLFVCKDCAGFGIEVVEKKSGDLFQPGYAFKARENYIGEMTFISGFGQKIRRAREQKNLTIKEVALSLHERESFLHKVEQEKALPDKKLTDKIEKFFGFKITE